MPDETMLHHLLQLKGELEQTIDELTDAKAFCRSLHAGALSSQAAAPSVARDLTAFNVALSRAQTRLNRTRKILLSFRQQYAPTASRQRQRQD